MGRDDEAHDVDIASVEWRTPPPLAVGSQLDFVARFLGRRLTYTYEVADLVPGQRLVMRTSPGPFPMETTYEWLAVAEGRTVMTLRNRGAPSGFGRVAAPALAAAVRRSTTKDLARLEQLLERWRHAGVDLRDGRSRPDRPRSQADLQEQVGGRRADRWPHADGAGRSLADGRTTRQLTRLAGSGR